ncbi:MAG: hypothetical protein A3J29_06090 [Acidobacteria bacterium RIFCSPLOWO2_12_FULL_67_14b]|nr:MAG: hypothetical protein A3J29_06090 [Acidobacteria bacterium RIFCSPLOWO2_12_FULL_67_14b]
MPETPDFEQIARDLVLGLNKQTWDGDEEAAALGAIAEQLRQVWNARGAADVKALFETRDRMAVGDPLDQSRAVGLERVIDDHLAPALRSLDR